MSMMCRFLEWDSDFFGFRIAQIDAHRITATDLPFVFEWCAQQKIDCLYFLADSDHAETIEVAETQGFHLKDIRMTYQHRLEPAINPSSKEPPANIRIRSSQTADIAALEEIAQASYTDTRFYYDRRFPREAADRLYRTWIRNSCEGYADAVLVLERSSQPFGYITCDLRGDRSGQIGLVGLHPQAREQGLGQHLVAGAFRWFVEHDIGLVTVVTQARNIRAQRLYQRMGFVSQSVQIWYHKWFDTSRSPE